MEARTGDTTEIRINRDMYEYIRVNELNTRDGLHAAFKTGSGLSLPSGAGGGVGTIEIKAAWRMVPDGRLEEFKPRYKLSKAKIDGVEKIVALIGLHIAKKTPKLDQWSWATFEHESNAPPEGAAPGDQPYNLFDAKLPGDYRGATPVPPDDAGKSSCIACHRMSSITPTFKGTSDRWHTDFSALFFNAK